jgi:hypothetical protein
MIRTTLLATSAIVALVFASGPSMAQQDGGAPPPAEKMAPRGAKQPPSVRHQNDEGQNTSGGRNEKLDGGTGEALQNRGRHETTGQAPREDQPNRPNERMSVPKRNETEQAPRSERNGQPPAIGQAPRQDRPTGDNRTTGQAPREDSKDRASEQNRFEQERGKNDREENHGTVGQGARGTRTNVNVTPEKRARIHETIIHERNAARVSSVNFDVSVGAQIARGVPLTTLPRAIVEIEPEWRDFQYFIIGQEIVIVDPRSLEIVAIVDA